MKQRQFFHIFFRKEAFFICMLFLKKKSYSPGEGLKWQTIYHRFQFCQKILRNLDISRGYYWFEKKFCCHAEFKFWKIDQNLHKCRKCSKILPNLKNMIFFVNWRPVSGFQFNVFWNGKFIITTSFKKPYEISGFALSMTNNWSFDKQNRSTLPTFSENLKTFCQVV